MLINPEQRRRTSDLIAQLAQDGQPEAWAELHDLLRPFALGYAKKRLGNGDAEDVVEDAFLRLRQVVHRYRPGADGRSFWYKILLHSIMKERARQAERGTIRSPFQLEPSKMGVARAPAFLGDLSEPEREAQLAELREEHDAFIKSLPPAEREVAALRVFEGLKTREAAQRARCTLLACKKRLARVAVKANSKLGKFRRLLLVLV